MDKVTIERSIWIDASPQDVWHAITETRHIKHWWGDDRYGEITELRVGAPIQFGANDDPILGTITVVDPPREFAYQRPSHQLWGLISVTTHYHLEEEKGGTRVTVSEGWLGKYVPWIPHSKVTTDACQSR